MAAYIVAYHLRNIGCNHDRLASKIMKYPSWLLIQSSLWIINTDHTSAQVYDDLSECLDDKDELFVGQLGPSSWKAPNLPKHGIQIMTLLGR